MDMDMDMDVDMDERLDLAVVAAVPRAPYPGGHRRPIDHGDTVAARPERRGGVVDAGPWRCLYGDGLCSVLVGAVLGWVVSRVCW
jgi:hypothetical protein